jgi:hypothetical protein
VTTSVDMHSYLQPMIESLRMLACEGVDATGEDGTTYTLRAHLLTISGDMPSQSKVSLPDFVKDID